MLWSVCTWKPALLPDVIQLAQVWFDHFFQSVSGKSDVGGVSVHDTVLEISKIHKDVHKVVVELQHPDLGILVHEASNAHGQVLSDGLLVHLQLKGLLIQLITKGRVHQMTTVMVLLAMQNINMTFIVGLPIRRIAFQLLRLCHNLLLGSISPVRLASLMLSPNFWKQVGGVYSTI